MYTRELNNASMASSSPNMAPTLASENAVGRGNIAGCQAGDLSCDMGGMYITTYSSIYLSICLFNDLSIWLALLVYLLASWIKHTNWCDLLLRSFIPSSAQLRAKNIAKKREQVEQAVRESEHDNSSNRRRNRSSNSSSKSKKWRVIN